MNPQTTPFDHSFLFPSSLLTNEKTKRLTSAQVQELNLKARTRAHLSPCSRLRVAPCAARGFEGSGFGVQSWAQGSCSLASGGPHSGCKAQGSGLRVWAQGSGSKVYG